jgi:hypothetical protein
MEDGKHIQVSGRESCLRSFGRQRRGHEDLEGYGLYSSGYIQGQAVGSCEHSNEPSDAIVFFNTNCSSVSF